MPEASLEIYVPSIPSSVRELGPCAASTYREAWRCRQLIMTSGATSALKLRVDVGGRSYLLRVEGKPSPLRNPYQYQSMRIAAGAGIAPKIRYLDELARVVVMDFIEGRSLQDYPGGRPALARAL